MWAAVSLAVFQLLLHSEIAAGGRFGGGGRGGGGGGFGGGRGSSSGGGRGWSLGGRGSSSGSGSYPKQQWGSSGSSGSGSSGSYPKQQWGSGSGKSPSSGSIGGGGFVNPGYGSSSAGGPSYRSPGYGTNFGTSFAGGTGKYGGAGYTKKALGLGVGAGFIGGFALGTAASVATMGVYHRYHEYQRLMYMHQYGYYNDDYYYSYYRRGQCYGGCPFNSHCIYGLCQCNPGYHQDQGRCYLNGKSAPDRSPGFDPYQPCSDSRQCHSIDINLVCLTNSTGGSSGRCSCRKDMRWNNATGECLLYLDVDCSRITYDTKPSQVVLEAANATLAVLSDKVYNSTLDEIDLDEIRFAEGNETLSNNETSVQEIELAINKTLANSLLSNIDPKKASEAEIKEAFCRDIDSFSWELELKQPPPNHSVPTAIGVVVAIVLIAVCCCGCFFCCCKSKAKKCLGRKNKGKVHSDEQMSFTGVKPADNNILGVVPEYQQPPPAYPPADSYQAGYQSGYPGTNGLPYPPPAGAAPPTSGQPYPPGGGGLPYPPTQTGYQPTQYPPVYPPAHSS